MADYIEKVPQEMFDMADFRQDGRDDINPPDCNSVGCVIGHCARLDAARVSEEYADWQIGGINFTPWSYAFTGLEWDSEWQYLFGSPWKYGDNTSTGAAKRIRYFVENGLPEDWREQMYGHSKLSYV